MPRRPMSAHKRSYNPTILPVRVRGTQDARTESNCSNQLFESIRDLRGISNPLPVALSASCYSCMALRLPHLCARSKSGGLMREKSSAMSLCPIVCERQETARRAFGKSTHLLAVLILLFSLFHFLFHSHSLISISNQSMEGCVAKIKVHVAVPKTCQTTRAFLKT